MAVAMTGSPKMFPHCPKLRLLAMDDASPLIPPGDELKEEVSAVGVHGDIADRIDDERPGDSKVPPGGDPPRSGRRGAAPSRYRRWRQSVEHGCSRGC